MHCSAPHPRNGCHGGGEPRAVRCVRAHTHNSPGRHNLGRAWRRENKGRHRSRQSSEGGQAIDHTNNTRVPHMGPGPLAQRCLSERAVVRTDGSGGVVAYAPPHSGSSCAPVRCLASNRRTSGSRAAGVGFACRACCVRVPRVLRSRAAGVEMNTHNCLFDCPNSNTNALFAETVCLH